MFAPPPVQLSRAEVTARLEAKRRNAGSVGSLTRTTSSVSDKSTSLHRLDPRSPTSPSKRHVFSKGGRIKVSSPVGVSSPTSPQPPKKPSSIFKFTAGEVDSPDLLDGFAEHPRRAPEPPRRGTRPPSAFFEQRTPPQRPIRDIPAPAIQQPEGSPPLIPLKSPKRQLQRLREDATQRHTQSAFYPDSLNHALSNLRLNSDSEPQSFERPGHPRSLSAPSGSMPEEAVTMIRPRHNRSSSRASSGFAVLSTDAAPASGSKEKTNAAHRDGKVEKPKSKRDSAVDSIRNALLEYNELQFPASQESTPRRATEGDIDTTMQNSSFEPEVSWKRRKKGEAIETILYTGSTTSKFAVLEHDKLDVRVPLPLPLSLLNKDLPTTPTSVMATPTELYQVITPRPSRPALRNRNARHKKRSPLAPISITHVKANSIVRTREDTSPSRLSVIPELSTVSENSPISSGFLTPSETQIHLRNGSVVTVSPPELTAWKRSCYIQGPIKLPKPVIVPRKNSMASLEAFQEAIAQVYQEALNIPRRRSDDACVDDVCEFFDDFGFDEVSYEGDILAAEDIMLDEVKEERVEDEEGFVTPFAEEPSPVEKVLAQEIVHVMAKPSPMLKSPIPPVQNEETLRAKGIARLHRTASSQRSPTTPSVRKDSLTISKAESVMLPLLPLPEESMLEAVINPARAESNDVLMVDQPVDQGHSGRDNEVEELDGHTSWIAPGVFPRKRGNKSGHRRQTSTTPMQRMMELVFL